MENKVKTFISYSHGYKNNILFENLRDTLKNKGYILDFSEKEDKSEYSIQTIWDYLASRIKQSSCTILLMTQDLLFKNKHKISYIPNDFEHSGWIYKEISASLRDWKENRINALICVCEDEYVHHIVNSGHYYNNVVTIRDKYPEWCPEIISLNEWYIEFVSYDQFIKNPEYYINNALWKRRRQIESYGNAYSICYDPHNN
ncbi:Uncharacterised protein [Metamycoplasma cloacale]|uniref:Uncharacterized protein n=1 Tax=Metamycoplasma cloacale TaxID=92401 RepID=A0A2Z4LLC7_9BACT|nr:TIR domain-containing protein [Metamycoplasma cloacale]AWX42475.1 hypothetical protein DK849_00010 [Metamycoplasma cloacale]VEU79179.1 Uncharacterised protein [Metamycoplasma cloacale]